MNDPDLVNNKFQLHRAHEAAEIAYRQLIAEFERESGRAYPALETYGDSDAAHALFLLNSAAETAKDAIDQAQKAGRSVRLLRPNVLRPFPAQALRDAARGLRSILIGDRADTPGSEGGGLSHEVRATIQGVEPGSLRTLSRVYGLGGLHFRVEDALKMIDEVVAPEAPAFRFYGQTPGDPGKPLPQVFSSAPPSGAGFVRVEGKDRPVVSVADPAKLAMKAKRIAPGHGACPGCGIFSGLDQFFKGIEGEVVVLYHTGCAMVVTTGYPFSAHRVTYLHNLFQNGAPTLSGLVEVFHEKKRRGEISASQDITFVMVTGDGGMDIGMGPTIGTALRNHGMIVLEYDNQGYMNTGGQLSYTTPQGHQTATSRLGKMFPHKNTMAIMAATGIDYCFSAIESTGLDLVEKAAKAQWYARHRGFAFGKLLVSCPLNWKSEPRLGQEVLQKAADCCFFPLYEVEQGKTRLSYNPETLGRKIPISDWLESMGKTQHLLSKPEELALLQARVDRDWARLKALHEHPLL